jgi:2-dehydropantoate 2-reductase
LMNKNIVLFGAGAIGSCIAAYLAREGHEITVIDPWFAHMVAIQKRGLHVTDPEGEFTVNMRALHVDQVKDVGMPIDILFLAVKSQDTEWSTRYLAPYLSTEGLIVSAQNSLNEEMISSVVGPEKTMGLVVSIPAAVYEPGEVVRNSAIGDRIDFQVGELDGSDTPRLRELAELMSKAGQIEITDNIWGLLWSKLGTNCMVNSIAGLTGLSLSPMCKNAIARKVMMRIGKEVVTVGEASGIKFDNIVGVSPENFRKLDTEGGPVIEEAILKMAPSHGGIRDSRPSMLQDILKARRSEIDYLNGLVVRKGKEKGIATPINQAVVDVMHLLDAGEMKVAPSNLELFKEYI